MITLTGFPKNKGNFVRLLHFFKEILDICDDIKVKPIVDGSLAVFAYTKNREMNVNDIDLAFPEGEFSRIAKVLEKKRINYKLREWHVLQVLKDDLKIDLGSLEYWYKNLQISCDILQIDSYKVKILRLSNLKELYKLGIKYFASKNSEPDRTRFEAYKIKYDILKSKDVSNVS